MEPGIRMQGQPAALNVIVGQRGMRFHLGMVDLCAVELLLCDQIGGVKPRATSPNSW